jgi:GT2 family glycosyltransferase
VISISVHIVTYNNATTLQACLESLTQQREVEFNTVILDNASSDETRAMIRALDIPLIESPKNLGYAAAHNNLINQTDSTYVLTLNPDVQLRPDFLRQMKLALDSSPSLGSAAGCLLRVERLGDDPTHVDSAGLQMRRNRHQGLLAENLPLAARPSVLQPIFGPDGAAAFYRRAMLDDVRVMGEVFDVDFFMHKEDVDLCWRAQLRGWKSLYVPEAIGHHIRSFRPGRREKVSPFMRFLGVRNRYLLMMKNEIPAHFRRDFPYIAAYDTAIVAYMLLRERSSLRALASAWMLRGRALTRRRIIQAGRRVDWHDIAQWFQT